MLPKIVLDIQKCFNNAKYISVFLKDNELLENDNTIWVFSAMLLKKYLIVSLYAMKKVFKLK